MAVLNIEVYEKYAIYSPVAAQITFRQAIALVGEAISLAATNKVSKLVVDTTGLTGFGAPTTMDQYIMGQKWAELSAGLMKVALVARAEIIDPQRFGLIVARNRGVYGDVFTTREAAVAWLLEQHSD
jgi:hypothetical protein